MKIKTNKILNNLLFFSIGLLLFFIGLYVSINKLGSNGKIKTTAVISEITTYRRSGKGVSHRTIIKYKVNQIEYEEEIDGYSNKFYIGKKVDIYYYINNPHHVQIISLEYATLILPGLGLIFMLVPSIDTIYCILKYRKKETLLNNNIKIIANIVSVNLNDSKKTNGKNQYNIICEWNNPTNNKKYIFKSENIYFNPSDYLTQNNKTEINVYVDNYQNINKYYVDISDIESSIIDLR